MSGRTFWYPYSRLLPTCLLLTQPIQSTFATSLIRHFHRFTFLIVFGCVNPCNGCLGKCASLICACLHALSFQTAKR
ncbi:hypothetical protein BH10PLA2_BH10PLA2_26710 [soil metagenome]